MRSGSNPSRRNRNIGTSKYGHGLANHLVILERWRGAWKFWEKHRRAARHRDGPGCVDFSAVLDTSGRASDAGRAMKHLLLVTALLTGAACSSGNDNGDSGGGGNGLDGTVCDAAKEHADACGVSPEFRSVQACHDDALDNCQAQCTVAASCDDLYMATTSEQCESTTYYCRQRCYGDDSGQCATPLVLSFSGAPVRFGEGSGAFRLAPRMSVRTDWPTAATPWLALDRNRNGVIDDGSELFGSTTPVRRGGLAHDGFEALRDMDSDGDGLITPADEGWSDLLVWADHEGDGVSSPDELIPVSRAGLAAIQLDFVRAPRCDARGNCEVERAGFMYRAADGQERVGAVVDVHLLFQRD